MGIAHRSQSLLAQASPRQPDKPPALCRRGPAEFWCQELKNPLQLHPARTSPITPLGALWSAATVHHHPLPTARRSVAAFCSYPHHRLQWSLVTEGRSSLLLSGPAQQYPPGLSPSIITETSSLALAGHILPFPLNQRGFSPSSKGL